MSIDPNGAVCPLEVCEVRMGQLDAIVLDLAEDPGAGEAVQLGAFEAQELRRSDLVHYDSARLVQVDDAKSRNPVQLLDPFPDSLGQLIVVGDVSKHKLDRLIHGSSLAKRIRMLPPAEGGRTEKR